jgi:hypothetical protein
VEVLSKLPVGECEERPIGREQRWSAINTRLIVGDAGWSLWRSRRITHQHRITGDQSTIHLIEHDPATEFRQQVGLPRRTMAVCGSNRLTSLAEAGTFHHAARAARLAR